METALENKKYLGDEEGGQLVEMDQAELVHMLRLSDEFFIQYFLHAEMSEDEVQDFHLVSFKRFCDLEQRLDVIALPREHAKTTYLRLAFVKMIYFSPCQFFVYVSATQGLAAASVSVIWNRIIGDEGIAAFGAPNVTTERLAEGHLEFFVTAYDKNGEPYRKFIILKALGAQQTLRGMNLYNMRPQFVGCDDIEDESAVKTEEGYRKFKHWFDNTFMRAISRKKGGSKIAQIGNLIGLQTLLNDNIKDPEWRSMRLGVVRANGKPLWPGSWSIEQIKADFERAKRRGQLSAWMGEMMNMPYNMENALIPIEQIFYTPMRNPADPNAKLVSFITIDPAISKETTADHCAIVLHSIDETGLPQISEYVHAKGINPFEIAAEVETLCLKWGCSVVGVESVQLQKVLLYFFELYFAGKNMQGMHFVPIDVGRSHKTGRLISWAAAIKAKEYSIVENEWGVTNQLISFDTRKDNNSDDLIDACAMGPIMLKYYPGLIAESRANATAPETIENEVAGASSSY